MDHRFHQFRMSERQTGSVNEMSMRAANRPQRLASLDELRDYDGDIPNALSEDAGLYPQWSGPAATVHLDTPQRHRHEKVGPRLNPRTSSIDTPLEN